ncbi:hypothetical protein V8C42DRAFT_307765 [Trichoderma barbatum]
MANLKELPNVILLELDVTSTSSIDAAVKFVSERTDGKLDCLCNNAGVIMMMPVLDTDTDEAQRMFDVNLWGPLAMIKAFASLIIQAKGTIVNTGSVAGYLNVTFGSLYSASKAALMRMSETLRLELAPLGVKVLTVVTGIVPSHPGSGNTAFQLPPDSLYKAAEASIRVREFEGAESKMDAKEYAERYVRAVRNESSGLVWIGQNGSVIKWEKALPSSLLDDLVSQGTGLDQI